MPKTRSSDDTPSARRCSFAAVSGRTDGHRHGHGVPRPWCPEGLRYGAELADQSSRPAGKHLEVVALVELPGVVVDGVDQHDSSSRATGGVEDRPERVDEQVNAEPGSVQPGIDGELGQEDRRDLMGRTTGEPRCGVVAHEEVRRQCEVADDTSVLIDQDEGACPLPGGGSGVTAQPVVELRLAAGEAGEIVVSEWLDAMTGLLRVDRS